MDELRARLEKLERRSRRYSLVSALLGAAVVVLLLWGPDLRRREPPRTLELDSLNATTINAQTILLKDEQSHVQTALFPAGLIVASRPTVWHVDASPDFPTGVAYTSSIMMGVDTAGNPLFDMSWPPGAGDGRATVGIYSDEQGNLSAWIRDRSGSAVRWNGE